MFLFPIIVNKNRKKTELSYTYSVPDGVLNGGVGTIICCGTGSTEPGGNVKFNLFFDILFIVMVDKLFVSYKITKFN